jgi:tetratricopeptide (TPR) repeat protein
METFSKAEVMFLEADSRLQHGDYEEGFEILNSILTLEPDFAPAYNHIGWLYFVRLNELSKAEDYFKKTIELDQQYAPVYPNYAALLNSLERFDELGKLVTKALKIKNVDVAALHYELATMYEVQQDFVQSEKELRLAVRYSLSNSDVRLYSEALERISIKKDLLR